MQLDRRAFLGLLSASATLAATPLRAGTGQISIVATTSMIADAARQIGGDLVNVRALMGVGVDPHSYRQTRSDIVALTRADLVLWHGLYLEAQMEDFLLKLAQRNKVVAVGEAVPGDQLISHASYEGRYDPHVWMAPGLWTYVVSAVAQALSDAAPDHASIFAANAKAHLSDVCRLDAYARDKMATIPQAERVLLTAHDAFGYFGRAYGVEVIGIQGISTESEAGLNRISMLVNMLAQRNIRSVFVESSVSDRNIRALIEGAAAQDHEITIGGELYSDAMGAEGSYEGTYSGMLDHNITTIAYALGGDVPGRGMDGKLMAGS
jgi:manganese/zinc/iron transport system substrate-binding protein